MPGVVIDVLSPKSFLIQIKDVIWKRHVDQLRHRQIPTEQYSYGDDSIDRYKVSEMTSAKIRPVVEHKERLTYIPEEQTVIQVPLGSDEPIENNDFRENRNRLTNQVVTNIDKENNLIETEDKIRTSERYRKPPKRLIEEK